MAIIKSVYSKLAEYTRTLEISDHAGGKNLVVRAGSTKLGVTVSTAELADALGLVTREEAADMERATEALRAETIRLRNGLSEAKVAKGAWKAKWEIEHERAEMLDRTARELRAKLDEAEATIARVRHLRDVSGDTVGVEELDAALDPEPAFVLPTEAGVRFTAKRVGNLAHTAEFVTITDGAGTAFYYIPDDPDGYTKESDRIWPADCVMSDWTDHRLIKPQLCKGSTDA